ncbi:MAG: protein kinase [Gemmataceae bacterium]
MTSRTHPTGEQLEAFCLGLLPPRELEQVAEHISVCEQCCRTLAAVQNDTVVDLARQAKEAASYTALTDAVPTANIGHGPKTETIEVPPELRNHPRYEVAQVLGRGGMGVVFKGYHRMMERTVALKVINPEYTANPMALGRFHREVRAAARLSHPNIVNAFDADQAGERHFLVMEYVDGQSLDKVIQKHGPLPVGHVCNYVVQAANGLQHAHDLGMVHRDIKPHNLMLTRDGRIKILDFGLARIVAETRQTALRTKEKTLTQFNIVIGTPDYMAPEQAQSSRDVDQRCDLYSLGCTMYHMLTGQPPFPGGSAMQKLLKHAEARPTPVEHHRNDVPLEVIAVLNKLLAKKPTDRYQTPAHVSRILLPFSKTASAVSIPQTAPVLPQLPSKQEHSATELAVPVAHLTASQEGLPVAPGKKRKRFPIWIGVAAAVLTLLVGIGFAIVSGYANLGSTDQLVATNPEKGSKESHGPSSNTPTPQHKKPSQPTPPSGSKPKVLYVLPYQDYWPKDFEPIRDDLVKKGIEVHVAANKAGWCTPSKFAKEGSKVRVEKVLTHDFDAKEYDAIVFGGWKTGDYCKGGSHFQQVGHVLHAFQQNNQIVAAICTGQQVLGDHDILKNCRVAWCDKLTQQQGLEVSHFGAKDLGDRVYRNGNVITARDPEDGQAFASLLVTALRERREK